MFFFLLHIYNDPVFESKPYYINVDPVLDRHRYAFSLLYILGPHIYYSAPYLLIVLLYTVSIKIKVRTHHYQLHDHVNYY